MVDTDSLDSLPNDSDADGYLGWGFLQRFKTAFDFNKGRMIIDLEGADLTNDNIRKDFKIQGFPTSDWTGMYIAGEAGLWATSGFQTGDILTSIDGVKLSKDAMYSLIQKAAGTPNLCWTRGSNTEMCGKVKASETEDK